MVQPYLASRKIKEIMDTVNLDTFPTPSVESFSPFPYHFCSFGPAANTQQQNDVLLLPSLCLKRYMHPPPSRSLSMPFPIYCCAVLCFSRRTKAIREHCEATDVPDQSLSIARPPLPFPIPLTEVEPYANNSARQHQSYCPCNCGWLADVCLCMALCM
jgi:hypothetical protein